MALIKISAFSLLEPFELRLFYFVVFAENAVHVFNQSADTAGHLDTDEPPPALRYRRPELGGYRRGTGAVANGDISLHLTHYGWGCCMDTEIGGRARHQLHQADCTLLGYRLNAKAGFHP